jgi:hypothetical protein
VPVLRRNLVLRGGRIDPDGAFQRMKVETD